MTSVFCGCGRWRVIGRLGKMGCASFIFLPDESPCSLWPHEGAGRSSRGSRNLDVMPRQSDARCKTTRTSSETPFWKCPSKTTHECSCILDVIYKPPFLCIGLPWASVSFLVVKANIFLFAKRHISKKVQCFSVFFFFFFSQTCLKLCYVFSSMFQK